VAAEMGLLEEAEEVGRSRTAEEEPPVASVVEDAIEDCGAACARCCRQ